MRATMPVRLARSAAFAVACVLLGAGAHWFAGGTGPTPLVLLLGGLVVMITVAALAGRERSASTVIGLMLAAQLFLHLLLGPSDLSAGQSAGQSHEHGLGVGLGMLLAHVTATLITGWWLARGEAALWAILRRLGTHAARCLRMLFALVIADVTDGSGPLPMRAEPADRSGPRRVLEHAVVRRGPPVLTFS